MSGNPTGSNVVPMPHAQAPASNPQQMPMPFPMWGGGGGLPWGPGCCPPGGMDALMKCYCDVQAATAFICSVMVQCVQTNPAVTAAIIAAIEASGSSLPLTGVTNGSDAQPGQVGEYVQFSQLINYAAGNSTNTATMGVLNPGDWDCWSWFGFTTAMDSLQTGLNPLPAGFTNAVGSAIFQATPSAESLGSQIGRASISVPTLINYTITITTAAAAGTMAFYFAARRRR